MRRARGPLQFGFLVWVLWSAAPFGSPAAARLETPGPAAGDPGGGGGGAAYTLSFSLQVTGRVTFLAETRFCSAEELHLRLRAEPASRSWLFRSTGLAQGGGRLNFGIGEGPRRHQRYVLLTEPPSPERMRALESRIVRKEALFGCAVGCGPGQGGGPEPGPDKKTYFNTYLLENPADSFRFELDPQGKTVRVENATKIRTLQEPGGRRANPRFFELLEYALLCVPPFSGSFVYSVATEEPVQWEMACRPILEGLVQLVKHVYGRKMTLVDAENLESQRVVYRGKTFAGGRLLWARTGVDRLPPVPIRVSGLKGAIWIERFRRKIILDLRQRRVLKDAFDISFGIVRDTKVLPVSCEQNSVRVVLVEEGFVDRAPPETDDPPSGPPAAWLGPLP